MRGLLVDPRLHLILLAAAVVAGWTGMSVVPEDGPLDRAVVVVHGRLAWMDTPKSGDQGGPW